MDIHFDNASKLKWWLYLKNSCNIESNTSTFFFTLKQLIFQILTNFIIQYFKITFTDITIFLNLLTIEKVPSKFSFSIILIFAWKLITDNKHYPWFPLTWQSYLVHFYGNICQKAKFKQPELANQIFQVKIKQLDQISHHILAQLFFFNSPQMLVCNESVLFVLSISSHRILKRYMFKNRNIKLYFYCFIKRWW